MNREEVAWADLSLHSWMWQDGPMASLKPPFLFFLFFLSTLRTTNANFVFNSSAIIDKLIESCQSQPSFGIAYFYFDFNNHSTDQRLDKVVQSLIVQISSQSGAVPQTLRSLYQRCQNGTLQPSITDLVQAFHDIIKQLSQVYIVLDSADESKEARKLLDLLRAIAKWKLSQIHILLTSRKEIDIREKAEDCKYIPVFIEETFVNAEVEKHVLAELENDPNLKEWDVHNQGGNIARILISGAHGKLVPQ